MTWQVAKTGRDYELSAALKPLAKHRADLTVFSGLHHPNGLGQAHVCADTWLTGAKIDAQSARSYHNTVSADQLMAEVVGPRTRFTSLELSIAGGTGEPNNTNTLAFSRDGVPLPADEKPQAIFDRVFGVEAGGVAAQRARLDRRHSVLDTVLADAKDQRSVLGTADRSKLDEYLHAVRDVEQRVERLDSWLDVPKPKVDGGRFQREVPRSPAGDYYRTMYDLIVLALRTDMTRVVTYMTGTEGNALSIPEIGITQSRHNLSHHNGDPEVLARLEQGRRLPDGAVRLLPRPARRGRRGRREPAGADDGAVRQRHELRPQPLQQQPADPARRRRGARPEARPAPGLEQAARARLHARL